MIFFGKHYKGNSAIACVSMHIPFIVIPNTLNVSFANQIGADVLGRLNDIAALTGSACHSLGRIRNVAGLASDGASPQRLVWAPFALVWVAARRTMKFKKRSFG